MISIMRDGKRIAPARAYLFRLVAIAPLALVAGCFFTDPVNTRPVAAITVVTPLPHYRGLAVTVNALGSSDADGDPLSYAWTARHCPTPTTCAPAPLATSSQAVLQFTIAEKLPVQVELVVTDSHGASSSTTMPITPTNLAPEISALQLQGTEAPGGGYTLGRTLTLVAAGADLDDDNATWSWILDPPAGGIVPVDEDGVADEFYVFRPGTIGQWQALVRLRDDEGAEDTRMLLFAVVEDQPPCIEATDPPAIAGARYILPREDGPRRLSVETVFDDLDPYPFPGGSSDDELGVTHFRWWIAGPGATAPFAEIPGHDLHDLVVDPAGWAPGDLLGVRVEVQDRQSRATCAADQPTCSLQGNSCLQRVTWSLEIR